MSGVDCTSLEGVSDVDCHRGQCMVRKCARGYELVPSFEDPTLLECVSSSSGSSALHKQVGGTIAWKKQDM